jgi:CheY-like chemotaxis protein
MTKQRVLVVDDNPDQREVMSALLALEGFEVAGARDGEQALRALAADPYDFVVTDLLMPGKGGVETISELKRSFPNVKVVAVSGSVRMQGIDGLPPASGADAAMSKPCDPLELIATLRRLDALRRH